MIKTILAVFVAFILFSQTSSKQHNKDKGPFLWDDDVMKELKAVRNDHMIMRYDIDIIKSSLENHEKTQSNQQLVERMIIMETKMSGLTYVGAALIVAFISNMMQTYLINKKRDKLNDDNK